MLLLTTSYHDHDLHDHHHHHHHNDHYYHHHDLGHDHDHEHDCLHDSLINSEKPALRILSKICREDASTVFGSNLRKIAAECGVHKDELKQCHVKDSMSYFECPNEELWRIPLIHNLIAIRSNEMWLENFDKKDIESIIDDICTN